MPANGILKAQKLMRTTSKLIVTDTIMIDLGIELDIEFSDIEATRTDYRHSIRDAGFKMLCEWREALDILDLHILWNILRRAFDRIRMGSAFERKVKRPN